MVAINVTSTHSSITLTWEPPAPNLTYCVAVHALNISRDGHSRATEGAEYCMLSQTLFVFSSADSGHDFEFIVTAVSMLGRGPPSAHITANLSAVYFSPDLAVISSTASIDVSSTVSTVIMITPTPNLIQSMKNSPSSLFSVAAILSMSLYKCNNRFHVPYHVFLLIHSSLIPGSFHYFCDMLLLVHQKKEEKR